MPAINFYKKFAKQVESGEKRQTIRKLRLDGRNPKPGQTLYLKTGMRTKSCRSLREAVCIKTTMVMIDYGKIYCPHRLFDQEAHNLSLADGFNNQLELQDFFDKHYGLPFHGLLIKW